MDGRAHDGRASDKHAKKRPYGKQGKHFMHRSPARSKNDMGSSGMTKMSIKPNPAAALIDPEKKPNMKAATPKTSRVE
ncbi:MAG: hypothetical protein J6O18_02645 [Bacilli bacterium]|nr:hypothetical protein [Bacilli bacterium]